MFKAATGQRAKTNRPMAPSVPKEMCVFNLRVFKTLAVLMAAVQTYRAARDLREHLRRVRRRSADGKTLHSPSMRP